MADLVEQAYGRLVGATVRMDDAWKNRNHDPEERDAALRELNEAGQALAKVLDEQEKGGH